MALALGADFRTGVSECITLFGPGCGSSNIDGVVREEIAVEIESRTDKQVRGAVLDLVLHPFPKKLLVIVPAYTAKVTRAQCEELLGRFLAREDYRVVELQGTGASEDPPREADAALVRAAVAELRGIT